MNKARVIGVWDSKVDLVDSCLEETGGLGVDIVIDAGGKVQKSFMLVRLQVHRFMWFPSNPDAPLLYVFQPVRLYEEEPESKQNVPHKHDIISLLAVGGHWVTTEDNLQVCH